MRLFKVFFKHCVIGFFMLLCCRSDWWLLCGWWMQRWLQRPGMRRVCGRRGSTRSFVAWLRRCPADTWYAKGHDLAVAPRHRLQRMGAQMPPRLDSSFCTSDPKLSFKQNRKPFKNLTALHFFSIGSLRWIFMQSSRRGQIAGQNGLRNAGWTRWYINH